MRSVSVDHHPITLLTAQEKEHHWSGKPSPPAPEQALGPPWQELSRIVLDYPVPQDLEHCRRNVVDLTTLRNQIDALIFQHVRRLDTEHQEQSRLTVGECTDWLAANLNLTYNSAYGRLASARELEQLPHTAQRFARGEISAQQVSVILRRLRFVRNHLPQRLDEIDRELAAAAIQMSPQELELHGRSLLHALDPEAEQEAELEQHDRRFLELSQRWDGGFDLHGQLDPEAGAMARDVLKGMIGKRTPDDPRTYGQCRADALSDLFSRVLDEGRLPERGQERPHLTILVDISTLRGEPGSPPAILDWRVPVCGETAKRHLCDAACRFALVGGTGNGETGNGTIDFLHLGRSFRTTTKAQRLALEIRDGGCLWPGCPHPPKDCSPHHFQAWSAGGPTDYENLGLACQAHHFDLHERGFRVVEKGDGHAVVLRPDGSEYAPVTRHRWQRILVRRISEAASSRAP